MSETCKITIESGEHERVYCPVTADLPWSYRETGGVILTETSTERTIPCQIDMSGGNGISITWIVNKMKPGQSQTFLATAVKKGVLAKGRPRQKVTLSEDVSNSKVDVQINGQLFTSYHYGHEWVRPFLHPVFGPHGVRVTRNWPVDDSVQDEKRDHPHHKSIWVAYGDCSGVDNWSEEPNHGWQRHRGFLNLESGPIFGRIVATTDWCRPDERRQFEDRRELRFYALPNGARLFDLTLTFHMNVRDITFRDTKEGGLISIRVASSMDVPRGGRIENGYGGVNEKETWGKSAPWCDYSGHVDGKHVGIAVFDHEENPRYPTGWHVRNYGLMTANCFAWSYYRPKAKKKGDMTFKKGSRTTWRYRVFIHKGNAEMGKVRDRFIDFIAPPAVKLE